MLTTLNYISLLSCLAPLFAGILLFKRLSTDLKILLGLFVLVVIVEASGLLLSLHQMKSTLLYHIYTLIEFSLLMVIFSVDSRSAVLRSQLRAIIPVYAIFWLVAKLSFENPTTLDNFTLTVSGLILIAVASYMLFNLSEAIRSPLSLPLFWISVAVLIYFTGNLMVFGLGKVLVSMAQDGQPVTVFIHPIFNTLANICFTGGFLCLLNR